MQNYSKKNSLDYWDFFFKPKSKWEKNGGREQSRIFAQEFVKRCDINPDEKFSMLDVGCALGEAVEVFAGSFKNAELYGIDFSEIAVDRCKEEKGDIATFTVCSLDNISGKYDVIYCSNTLEHFPDFEDKAREILTHCNRTFYILVPYMELYHYETLRPEQDILHYHTFVRSSFDFLLRENLVKSIDYHIFSCPPAWGWGFFRRCKEGVKNMVKTILNRPSLFPKKQIMFTIKK